VSSDRFRTHRERSAYLAGYEAAKKELGDKPAPLTRAQVDAMSPEEVDANWDRVQDALRTGFAEADDEQ